MIEPSSTEPTNKSNLSHFHQYHGNILNNCLSDITPMSKRIMKLIATVGILTFNDLPFRISLFENLILRL